MISLPSKPKVTQKKENTAVFEIEGLYPGFGVTIGSSLRRVLFSSLEGAAVTQIKIEGAQHEFSTLPGVLEDVITIILNIKQLRFKIHGDEPQKAVLKITGDKEIKASDIELPTQVELASKDIHIATLTDKKATLKIEFEIEKGLGYVVAEQDKREKLEVGQISIDAIFTPIKGVNFKVESMRMGKRTDFNRLFLEIETDGTITPEEAFHQASEILVSHFSSFLETEKNLETEKKEAPKKEEKKIEEVKEDDHAKMKIEDLEISPRTANILINNNIKTVGGLLRKNEETLVSLEGMGPKGVDEIKKILKKLGLELK